MYDTKHPSGKAHGGTAVIVRNDIKHYLHSQVNKESFERWRQAERTRARRSVGITEISGLIKEFGRKSARK